MLKLAIRFWHHEGHFTPVNWREAMKSPLAKWLLAALVLNELRGLYVAGTMAVELVG